MNLTTDHLYGAQHCADLTQGVVAPSPGHVWLRYPWMDFPYVVVANGTVIGGFTSAIRAENYCDMMS